MRYSIKYAFENGDTFIGRVYASTAQNARIRLLSYFAPNEVKIIRVRKSR